MACAQCSRLGYDHDAIVALCRGSVYETAIRICGWDRIEGSIFHKAMCDNIQRSYLSGKHDLLRMWWRWGLKSTIAVALIMWGLENNCELRVLLEHASEEESLKKVKQLQTIILGEKVRHFFPELVPPELSKVIWRNNAFEIPRKGNYQEATVEARGVYSTVTGGHFDWIIRDDPVDEWIASSSAKVMASINHYDNSGNLFDNDSTRLSLTLGTLWEGGFYEHVEEMEGIDVVKIGCYVDDRYREFMTEAGYKVTAKDGEPIWKEFCGQDWIDGKKRFLRDPVKISRQLYLLPATESENIFQKSDVHFYNWNDDAGVINIPDLQINKILKFKDGQINATVDPAGGETVNADKSAIVVAIWYPDHALALIVEAWHGNVLPDMLINRMFDLNEKWKKFGEVRWGIEKAGLQSYLKRWARNEMVARGRFFSLRSIPVGNRSKPDRAKLLQPFLANAQVFFLRNQAPLIDQVLNFRVINGKVVGGSPNLMDALAMHADLWRASGNPYVPGESVDELNEDDVDYVPKPTLHRAYGLGAE